MRLATACVIAVGLCTVSAARAQMSPLAGDWHGALETSSSRLRLALHVELLPGGSLRATLDSPDEAIRGLALDEIRLDLNVVRFRAAGLHTSFLGKLSADTITGTLRQGANSYALRLERGLATAPPRPQTPQPPFPYRAEAVSFLNPATGLRLAGTFTMPPGVQRAPAVVMMTMSGPQDRDETIYGHKPFLLLADQLARRGIASLRYDDRGVNLSQGDYRAATTAELASDAEAALAYLGARDEVDRHHIGVIGHSEGGAIAALLAARHAAVRYAVLMAAPGLRGDELTLDQAVALKQSQHGTPQQCAAQRLCVAQLLAIIGREADPGQAAVQARQTLAGWADLDGWLAVVNNPWYRYFLTFEPAAALEKVKVPVLLLNGELDRQVAPDRNLAALQAALAQARNRQVTVRRFPGLNHLFQTAATGAPLEYGQIEETLAPVVSETIVRWIRQQTGLEKTR